MPRPAPAAPGLVCPLVLALLSEFSISSAAVACASWSRSLWGSSAGLVNVEPDAEMVPRAKPWYGWGPKAGEVVDDAL
jgi:hypothetical protein